MCGSFCCIPPYSEIQYSDHELNFQCQIVHLLCSIVQQECDTDMDVLSDVLATVRLSSAVHICPELSAPWGISFPAQTDRAVFYVLSRGSCYLEVKGMTVTLAGG